MVSGNALRKWRVLSPNCYASSNAATDMFASKVALELKAIRSQGISVKFSGVNNHGLIKLSFEILYIDPTTLGGDEIVWMTFLTDALSSRSSLVPVESDSPNFNSLSLCVQALPHHNDAFGRADYCEFKKRILSPISPEKLWARTAS